MAGLAKFYVVSLESLCIHGLSDKTRVGLAIVYQPWTGLVALDKLDEIWLRLEPGLTKLVLVWLWLTWTGLVWFYQSGNNLYRWCQ